MKRRTEKKLQIRKVYGKYAAGAVFLAGLLCLTGCGGRVQRYDSLDTAMGTVIRQSIYSGEDITAQVQEIIRSLEESELSWRLADTEIAKINAASGSGEAVPVSEKLYKDLTILLEVSQKSGGAFDFTVGPVVQLWNIDEWAAGEQVSGKQAAGEQAEAVIPDKEEIARALQYTGYEKVLLEDGGVTLLEGMSLDLGAVGKGLACDRIAALLEEKEVYGAVISVGGSILTYGKKPDGTPWQVGIINPENTSSMIGILSLEGQWCVSTSGDYERYVIVDGVKYHHILNPATGYPADSGIRSVTVLCKSGVLSDALSTACFVLGVEEGMELAKSYGAEVLFVDEEGMITMTDGMKDIFKETGEN